jgi:hypothetical protein
VDEQSKVVQSIGYGKATSIVLARLPSMLRLRELLTESAHSTLLGGQQEHPTDFWLARSSLWPGVSLGIAAIAGRLGPQFALSWQDPRLLFVGYSFNVTLLRLPNLEVLADHRQLSVFFTFLLTVRDGPLLAILETEVIAWSWNGQELWHRSFDILKSWAVIGSYLVLREFDGTERTLVWANGADVVSMDES